MDISLKRHLLYAALAGELAFLLLLTVTLNLFAFKSAPLFALLIFIGVIAFPLGAVFFICAASYVSRYIPSFFQIAKFILVGGLNTIVDLCVFNILYLLFGPATSLLATLFKGISFWVAVTNSYFWNKIWTFEQAKNKSQKRLKREFLEFLSVSVLGLLINITVFSTLHLILISGQVGFSDQAMINIAAISASVFSFFANFIGYKFFVFKI